MCNHVEGAGRSSFMFRQPTRASVSNVFLLPFARGVWGALAALAGGAGALLAALAALTRDADLRQLTPAEAFTFVIGTVCQQGFYLSPAPLSARLLIFSSLLLALFSFTAYSAKIVSILQAPSDAIQTIDDLVKSPLACGVQETTYKKVYFAESRDPATQRLYRKKLVPLGDAAYLSVVEGIARVRTGLFAFSVEESPGYDIISQTFTNREKCGLHQIPAFTPPPVSIPIRKHSGYKELLATRLRWQRETGLLSRWRRVWMAERPACDASGGDFVTVSLRDVLPALQIVGWGMLLSVVILFIERRVHKTSCELLTKRRRSMDQETDLSPVRSDNYEYIE